MGKGNLILLMVHFIEVTELSCFFKCFCVNEKIYDIGQFDWNTKHGKGIYTWPNGNEYKGDFIHEKLHGKGEMKYIMGHR